MPCPWYTFGLIYSRWHPYSDKEVLAVIERFRRKQIPLDMFVAATDWRIGSSRGYEVNRTLYSFPQPESGPVLEVWVPGQDTHRELELLVTKRAAKSH